MLPAATAVAAVLRASERPSRAFWLAASAGLVAVLAFVAHPGRRPALEAARPLPARRRRALRARLRRGRRAQPRARRPGDDLLGARAQRARSPPRSTAVALAASGLHAGATAWLGFAYVAVVSMFLGFFAWYAGLARGGVAQIGQVQLAQPVLTLVWSALLLGEHRQPGHARRGGGGAGLRRRDAAARDD